MIRKITVGLVLFLLVVGISAIPSNARAQDIGTLADIFVLDSLFGVGADGFTTLGDAFILDQLFITDEPEVVVAGAIPLRQQLAGYILLQVEDNGQAWYVNPKDTQRYYLNGPNSAFLVMVQQAIGISNDDLDEVQDNEGARKSKAGRFWIAAEANGELFYITPETYEVVKINGPEDAQDLIEKGLGISDDDIEEIPIAPGSLKEDGIV